MGCIQSPAPQSPSFAHVKTESGAVYISNDVPLVIWEYLEDINSATWVSYDTNNCRQIHVAYTTSAKKCQIMDKKGDAYEVDFEKMTETNVVNGWQRKIRIQPNEPAVSIPNELNNNNNNNILKSKSKSKSLSPIIRSPNNKSATYKQHPSISSYTISPKHANDINPLLVQQDKHINGNNNNNNNNNNNEIKFKWQWFSESIGWKDYDEKLSSKIDEAYVENIARYAFKIRSNNTKYEIDFDRMKQCNLDTNKLRVIRRVKIHLDDIESKKNTNMQLNDDINMEMDIIINDERFLWEYYNDIDGIWHEYNDNVSLKIETVHHSNAAIARMKIHGIEYEIRLNEIPMNQCNLKTGKISQLRRVIKSGHNKRISNIKNTIDINDPNTISKKKHIIKKFQWRFKEGFNVWKVYPNNLNVKIENAFRAELERYTFNMNGQQYEIQFNFLRMINLQTQEIHEIARIDNLAKNRSPSMFNQPANNNNKHIHINNKQFGKKKKKHAIRSYTVDMGSPKANQINDNNIDNNFQLLIKQQQKAMKYFNKQHEKKKSSMSLNLPKNEFNPDIINKIKIEEEKDKEIEIEIENENENENENDFIWKYKNDDGIWLTYTTQICNQIENAYQDGQDTIEIEKNGIFYEIRLSMNLECHFATNKMRPIQRIRAKQIPQIPQIPQITNNTSEINEEFDALSNNLEYNNDEQDYVETPADSEFALKDYGNDYQEYMKKIQSLQHI